jgi:excinuclease UvrABC helicase subunit UvrB
LTAWDSPGNWWKQSAKWGLNHPPRFKKKQSLFCLKGNVDLVGLAQTGTGKTAAFGLPLLQLVDDTNRTTQALIVAPTRELSVQITSDLGALFIFVYEVEHRYDLWRSEHQ